MAHHVLYGVIVSRWVSREALMALTEYLTEENCLWLVTRMEKGQYKGLYRLRKMGRLKMFEDGEQAVNKGGARC